MRFCWSPGFSSSRRAAVVGVNYGCHIPHVPQRRLGRRRRILCNAAPDPEELKKMQESLEAEMKTNPQFKAQMNQVNEALKNPATRQKLQETMEYMQRPEMQERLNELRNDPELQGKFKEIETGGIPALMKAMSDVNFLQKVGRVVQTPPETTITPEPANQTAATAPEVTREAETPEIKTIVDAAKYGDVEAVEDFLAIGKDPNLVDEHHRTPLHFSASMQHMELIETLLSAGADPEIADSKGNTPLHYAAGYGRVQAVERLLDAGANGAAKNENGKTPADMARLSEKNPVLQNEALIKRLDEQAAS